MKKYIVFFVFVVFSFNCFSSHNNQDIHVTLTDIIDRAKKHEVACYTSEKDIPSAESIEINFCMWQTHKAGGSREDIIATGYAAMLKCYNIKMLCSKK